MSLRTDLGRQRNGLLPGVETHMLLRWSNWGTCMVTAELEDNLRTSLPEPHRDEQGLCRIERTVPVEQ